MFKLVDKEKGAFLRIKCLPILAYIVQNHGGESRDFKTTTMVDTIRKTP